MYCTHYTGTGNHCYHPQRSCGKVMFLHLCVMLFTGGCLPQHTPQATSHMTRGVYVWAVSVQGVSVQGVYVKETPPHGQRPPSYGNERALRILLECIPVFYCTHPHSLSLSMSWSRVVCKSHYTTFLFSPD